MIKDYTFKFSKDNKPVYKASKKEVLKFKTLDCFCNQVKSEEDEVGEIDFDKANPATGPVYVNGCEKGDILVVKIIDIEVEDTGFIATIPELGPLNKNIKPRTKMVKIKDNKAKFNQVEFEINPMIGVIGVAPEGEDVPCGMWGSHGGNMDNKRITKDTTIYLPVNVDGALLQIGDLHAAMGDGEICGTGIEISGIVTVEVDVIKGKEIKRPVHETKTHYYTIANARTYDEALKYVTEDMQKLIMDAYGWDETDAYMYMSVQGDVEVAQGVKPSPGDLVLRFKVPKVEGIKLI